MNINNEIGCNQKTTLENKISKTDCEWREYTNRYLGDNTTR